MSFPPLDDALAMVCQLMKISVPVIGGATHFQKRTAGKRKRPLSIAEVIAFRSPCPLLVVPAVGSLTNHALCVVDDLVFDSITNKALLLCLSLIHI